MFGRRKDVQPDNPNATLWTVAASSHENCVGCLDLVSGVVGVASMIGASRHVVDDGVHSLTVARIEHVIAFDGMLGHVTDGTDAANVLIRDVRG